MNIKSQIESLLFVSAKPMNLAILSELTEATVEEVASAGDALVEEYNNAERGIQIVKNNQQYQMVSSPENAEVIRKFFKDETTGELSRASLETLTIIAYRGPITKLELERIRGNNCSLILRNLMMRGLVEVSGENERKEQMYSVTFEFIRFLGINDISQLPDYEKLHNDQAVDEALEKIDNT